MSKPQIKSLTRWTYSDVITVHSYNSVSTCVKGETPVIVHYILKLFSGHIDSQSSNGWIWVVIIDMIRKRFRIKSSSISLPSNISISIKYRMCTC